jgi:hypothetical protein
MRKIKYNVEDGVIGFSKTVKRNDRNNNVSAGVSASGREMIATAIVFVPDMRMQLSGIKDLKKVPVTGQFESLQIRPKVLMKDSKGYFYRRHSSRVSLCDKSVKKLKKRLRKLIKDV